MIPPPPNPLQMLANAAIAALPHAEIENLVSAIASVNQAFVSKWDMLFQNAFKNWPLIEQDTLKFHTTILRTLLDVVQGCIEAVDHGQTTPHEPGPVTPPGSEKIPVS